MIFRQLSTEDNISADISQLEQAIKSSSSEKLN